MGIFILCCAGRKDGGICYGIATILWNEFLRRCRENKLKLADFRALTDNQPALNFYKKQKCIFYGSTKGTDGLIREDIKYVFNTKRINHSKPTIDSEDINKFLEAMNTGNLATGKIVKEFEESLSKYIGKKFGVATNSGTNALYLALRALDVKEGDEVILPSYICGSVLNAVSYCRATPIVVDINEDDYNISFEQTKNKITEKTKAIILPHMFGNPVKDIEKFLELRVPIIEDCAMSIGAEHNGKKIGNFGEISIFSFYATKMIASGVGGMVLTSDEKIYSRFLDLMQYDNRENFDESYNYKMSDLQAALGLSQLKKLDSFVRKRKEIASRYNHLLENGNSEFNLPKTGENIFFRYIIQCRDKETDIDTFIEQIRKRGVDVAKPIYKPLHNYLALPDRDFPNTAKAYKTAISIPIYPN
jgi:dTDP-4-amino-4,6-dideoxygalactose transaminase